MVNRKSFYGTRTMQLRNPASPIDASYTEDMEEVRFRRFATVTKTSTPARHLVPDNASAHFR